MAKEPKAEFEKGFKERSGMSDKQFTAAGLVVVPCACDEAGCRGWRAAIKDKYRLVEQLQGLTILP
jgi:hypothetical protein